MTDCPLPRTLYIQGERRLDFAGWLGAIQKAAASSGDTLSEQQLGDSDIPVIVYRCVDYITQCGEPCPRGRVPIRSREIFASCSRGQASLSQDPSESSYKSPPHDPCLQLFSFVLPPDCPVPSSVLLLYRPDFRGHLPQVWADIKDTAAAGEPEAGCSLCAPQGG